MCGCVGSHFSRSLSLFCVRASFHAAAPAASVPWRLPAPATWPAPPLPGAALPPLPAAAGGGPLRPAVRRGRWPRRRCRPHRRAWRPGGRTYDRHARLGGWPVRRTPPQQRPPVSPPLPGRHSRRLGGPPHWPAPTPTARRLLWPPGLGRAARAVPALVRRDLLVATWRAASPWRAAMVRLPHHHRRRRRELKRRPTQAPCCPCRGAWTPSSASWSSGWSPFGRWATSRCLACWSWRASAGRRSPRAAR